MQTLLSFVPQKISKLESNQARWAPVYYILISSLLLTFSSTLSKSIKNIPSSQITYARAFIMFFCNYNIVQPLKIQIYDYKQPVVIKLIMRSVLGCIGTLCFYASFKYITISEGLVLFRTSPLWTALMAIYYLRTETLSKKLFLDLLLCFLGIILITQPPQLTTLLGIENTTNTTENDNQLLGVGLMICAAVLSSCIQVLINSLAGLVNQMVILQYFSCISMIVSSIALVVLPTTDWIIPNLFELSILSGIGISSYFSQLLMNRAYMKGKLTEISMLGQTQVIYGYIFDLIFGAAISLISICGTIIISISLLSVIQLRKK